MLTVNDNLMPSKYFTVCQDDGKIYLYDKTNTVDPATGKFRVFEGGGSGGASNLADLEDVLLTTLTDGQTLVWDDTEQKWVNADMPTVPTKVSDLENDSNFVDEDTLSDALEAKQDTLTAGDGIDITDDTISIDPMPSEDIDEVIDELPTGNRFAVTGYVPLGTIIPVFRETAPKFFLICDGSTYNKADYPELAELLLGLTTHSQYEVDGDNTKFKVPDLRGEFIRGTGSNGHPAEGDGAGVGVHQPATSMLMCWDTGSNLQFRALKNATSEITNADKSQTATGTIQTITATTSRADSGSVTHFTSRPTNTSVLFCIAYKDIYSNPMNDYSTDEKVVGTWIDGSTLYQKIVECGALPANGTKNVAHGITNLAYVVKMEGTAVRTSGTFAVHSMNMNDNSMRINTKIVGENVVVQTGGDFTSFTGNVTIQYTKA
jgi:hypothetical protein